MDDNDTVDDDKDGDEIFSLSPLIDIKENDFYKLSNVNSSARQAEIREVYKRRALEIHPNKNIVDTTRVFQAMKLTCETLNDEKRRITYDVNIDFDKGEDNYDDDNNDEIFFATENDQMPSHTGTKLSDIYKKQIDRYLTEYESLSFSNNFDEKLQEIIARAIETSASRIPVDNYIQCTICHQSCKDIHAHEREKYDPYEKIFNNAVTSISFEQTIDSNIWNWKAVERTVTHLPIWNIHEKWKQLSHFISHLKEPVQILCKSERYWTLLIDTYEQHKQELVKLPTFLSQVMIVNYLPDVEEIQSLKAIFEKYDQDEQRAIFSKVQNNDQRVESGNYYLVDITTTNKYIDINDFCFPITDPPSEIYREYCYDCQKSFSFFIRHHHCRMCGQQFCADCMMYKRIPHLGYIIKPVRICHKCSDEKQYFIYQHLLTYVKHLIESKRFQYLSIYLALLHQYKTNGNELFYRQTGVYFYQVEQYVLALQCFTYARLGSDEWFQYTIEFCKKSEYLFSLTCMKSCGKPDSFWLEQANLQRSSTFALLCYEHIKISIKKLFEIASQKLSDDKNACLSYLLYLNIKNAGRVNWKEFGEEILLKTNQDGGLAMFCFHLYGKMQSDEWNQIAQQLCHSNQLERLAYLLAYLYHVQQIDFRASENTYIYFLTKILVYNHTTISLDEWLNDICYGWSLDIDRIVIGLSITYNYKYTSWTEYKNHYIERKEYFITLICHKMAEYLTGNNETQWFINSIEDFDPIGYELYNSANHSSDWKQLGDQYFKDGKFIIALNCYLFCDQNEIDQIIIQQAQSPLLPLSTALLYYTIVYKRTRGNNPKIFSKNNGMRCNNIFYNICIVLSKQQHPYVLELVRSAISMYETDNPFKDTDLFKYHLLILNELEKSNDEKGKNDRLINGGVHILFAFNNLSDESIRNLTSLNQSLSIKSNTKVFTQLKSSTYKTYVELAITLLNPKNYFLEQLKQLFQQCLGRLELSEIRLPEYRSKMYLIQATIFKLENKPIESLCSAHNAILSYPFSIVMFSVVLFLNHSYFHSTVRQSLTNDIKDQSLHLVDITPPTQMKNFNFLERTERLIMSKKYERAIVKQLADNNSVQAAFSYIDLNMVISGNASLFPISLTMSCLHFYQAMTNPECTSAELYAYRSIIFDLSTEIFLYARHYLSLYVQVYIYKLLYTVILRSTDLFAKRITLTKNTPRLGYQCIIKDSHETLLDELVRNILQLSKVNPLTHVPVTSAIHDMVYMEYAGNGLLETYLKLKSANSIIYQYYYFEGVWKGWIDAKNFNDERQRCMKNLLNDRNWTMNDVENLLCWSLVPKTDDGWLFNTKHRLQLAQPAYAQVIGVTLNNETGDIEFMFTQAKKNEHNLFDGTDVIDVLRNGITYANFTLDPPNKDYHLHPFYEMKYSPKRLSQAPNYLLTLLHVDYLLKMISTGVEICSFQPFEMRSSSENLMQRLPTYIREELQAIPIKSAGLITDSIHRFWIQPQSNVEYEQTYYTNFFGRENKNITQFYLNDDLKMCVKQHRMKYDKMGNLIDGEIETDDEQSAEAQFARIFTKYYDEIGKYFPELLRLKELCKLSILSRIIQAKYNGQCEFISRIETDSKLDEHLKHVKLKLPLSVEMSNNSGEKTLTALSKILCKTYLCKQSNLQPYLINWLKYNQEKSLKQYVRQSLIEKTTKLKCTIEQLNFFFKDRDDNDNMVSNDSPKCSWVPATFSFHLNMKVYGGVAFNGNIKQVSGIKEMQEKSKSIIRIDANKLSANSDKQRSNQKLENMNSRKGELRVDGSSTEKISSGPRSQRGDIDPKSPSNESNAEVTTHSKTKSEARKKALECNGLSPDAELFDTDEIDNKNTNMINPLKNDAVAGRYCSSAVNLKLVQEGYWHSDGYVVWLRPNGARTYNERQPKGNTGARGAQKAHFNVFYQKETGIEETEQHHNFDDED